MKLGLWSGIGKSISIGLTNVAGPVDTTAPTVAITSTQSSPSMAVPVPITITFSEAVTGFEVGDITISGGSLANFADAGNGVYTVNWTTANGANTMDIAAGVCQDAAGNSNLAATQFAITSILFLLRDDFTDTLAGGAVNNTPATPGPGTRVVPIDTGNFLSIGGGVMTTTQGITAYADPRYYLDAVARAAGRTLFMKLASKPNNSSNNPTIGWRQTLTGGESSIAHGAYFGASTNLQFWYGNDQLICGNYLGATPYNIALVLRAAGCFFLVQGGAYTDWELLYVSKNRTDATVYPSVQVAAPALTITYDTIRVPTDLISITPLASDSFNRANGDLGNTDGAGAGELGGSGLAWTSQLGTWAIATNKAASSALDGGTSKSIATVDPAGDDYMVECALTRSAGNVGIVLRYTDASNYIYAYHDGTNAYLNKVVAGVDTNLVTAAKAYGAGNRLVVGAKGTKIRMWYGGGTTEKLMGTEQTVSDAALQAGACGLYTSDTGATFDNFVVWNKGGYTLSGYINP